MGDFAEPISLANRAGIAISAAFDRAGFATSRAVWHQIRSDNTQQYFTQSGAAPFRTGPKEGFLIASSRCQNSAKLTRPKGTRLRRAACAVPSWCHQFKDWGGEETTHQHSTE